jgi:Asp-tRNA(Asn)/Glu-tRNA(Gln) amidotransferase B subunit
MSAYRAAAHRIQTAIAYLMQNDTNYVATKPKHMRVGIDLTKSDMAGLVQLLIAKGVFTQAEYVEAITEAAQSEADSYEKIVQSVGSNRNIRTR